MGVALRKPPAAEYIVAVKKQEPGDWLPLTERLGATLEQLRFPRRTQNMPS